MVRLGIQKTHDVVCYDANPLGMLSVARVAWMLRYFGASNVRILNGGLRKWIAEGRAIATDPPTEVKHSEADGDYSYSVGSPQTCILDINRIHDLAGKLHNAPSASSLDFQIIDTRTSDRFEGTAPGPMAGLRSGGMKNAFNVPYMDLLEEDGTVKSNDDIAKLFEAKGIVAGKSTVCTCGIGVTACMADLGLRLLGNEDGAIYDGSWAEYG